MFRRTCKNCHRNYIPNSQNRDVTRLVCGKELCPNCNRNHFCPDHWNLLPTESTNSVIEINGRRKAKTNGNLCHNGRRYGCNHVNICFICRKRSCLCRFGYILWRVYSTCIIDVFGSVLSKRIKNQSTRNYSKNGVFVGTASNRSFTTKSNRHANFPTQYSDFNRNN